MPRGERPEIVPKAGDLREGLRPILIIEEVFMRIYLVPEGSSTIADLIARFDPRPNVLLSFLRVNADFRNFLHTHRPKLGKIMLDSGAYSEMAGTKKVDLSTYHSYLNGCGTLFDYCINLDVEPDHYDVRMWNLAKLRQTGLDILPVVHDPYAGEIDQLYDMGYRYLLLGSSWGNDRKQLDFIFSRYHSSGKYPGILFHKLGTASYDGLCSYPYYSSDSANFIKIGALGEVLFWNEHREPDEIGDLTDRVYFGGYQKPKSAKGPAYHEYPHLGHLEDWLWTTFEYKLSDIEGPSGAVRRWIVNGKYILDLQDRMTKLHGAVEEP
jgi:hypothetical protein